MVFNLRRIASNQEDFFMGHGLPRLTHPRYAGDILLFAKLLDELVYMIDRLLREMKHIGLSLNCSKPRNLKCNPNGDNSSINFIEIPGEFVHILDAGHYR